MSISNYLSDDEWDALYYLSFGPLGDPEGNLGLSMYNGVQALIEAGYEFEALDEEGEIPEDQEEVESINWMKLKMFTGNPHNLDPFEHLRGGREFVNEYACELLHDTDEEFEAEIQKARDEEARQIEEQRKLVDRVRRGLVGIPIPENVISRDLVGFAWDEAGEGEIVFGIIGGQM
jgi:hypothetical protein